VRPSRVSNARECVDGATSSRVRGARVCARRRCDARFQRGARRVRALGAAACGDARAESRRHRHAPVNHHTTDHSVCTPAHVLYVPTHALTNHDLALSYIQNGVSNGSTARPAAGANRSRHRRARAHPAPRRARETLAAEARGCLCPPFATVRPNGPHAAQR